MIDKYGNYALTHCTMTEYDAETDADVTISSAPCVLLGIYINAVLSAHAVNVMDAASNKIILPASMAAGTKIDCHSAEFATSLIINSNDSATGKIVFFWRAL